MDGWFWEKVSAKSGEPISVTQFGPLSLEELVAAVERGEIGATTRVSNGGERWKSAASFEELADALGLDGRKTPKRTPTPTLPIETVAPSSPVASSRASESVSATPSGPSSPDERVLPSPLGSPSGSVSRQVEPSTQVASSLSVAPNLPNAESAPKNWRWRNAQGTASEPSTLADLIDAAKRGEIGPSTQVSNDDATWKAAASVPALANALGLDRVPTPVPAPTPAKTSFFRMRPVDWILLIMLLVTLIWAISAASSLYGPEPTVDWPDYLENR